MTKRGNIKLFSKCTLNQAGWLTSVKSFDKIETLELPVIERVQIPPLESG